MKTLVTGGAGFIGSHLVDLLLERGDDVIVLDNFLTSNGRNLSHLPPGRVRLVRADTRAGVEEQFDQIYHLASPASPVDYGRYPIETLLANAMGTWKMLEQAVRVGARFLLASTSEVYGDPLVHPQREDYAGNVDPIGPRSCYDEGKRYAEALTVAYVTTQALDARIVRIFNSYGSRMRTRDGRMPSEFISRALQGEPLIVYGDGSQTRSLCYVTDTVNGLVAAMEKGTAGEVYNIGRPEEISVLDFAQLVVSVTQSHSPVVHAAGRAGEITRRNPDIHKAETQLHWSPKVALTDGLARTIEWYRDVREDPDYAKA